MCRQVCFRLLLKTPVQTLFKLVHESDVKVVSQADNNSMKLLKGAIKVLKKTKMANK